MLTRSLEKAKDAWKNKNAEASKKAHQQRAPEQHQQAQGQYIKSAVYGGLDGIITTFAVVAGVAGASLSAGVVLILGFANLIADGISMAIGDFLSTKAEKEYARTERKRESWEVENYPEGEMKEMIELYMDKGITEKDARQMVNILSKHKKAWVDVMMVEELGIVESDESPLKNALVTFGSFSVFGFIPLFAYVLARFIPGMTGKLTSTTAQSTIPELATSGASDPTFLIACILTGATLFTLGALKTKVTGQKWYIAGFEMLIVGGLAAAAAYLIGVALSGLA